MTISVFGNSSGKFTSEEELLLQWKDEITTAAELVGMSPRIIASIIYAEHKLNVKTGENILDYVLQKADIILLWELLRSKSTQLSG